MTIKASDIISRALALADLTNTSFPTSAENRYYINNVFRSVYQEAINEGQKYWFEEAEFEGTDALPEDFYQLYDLKDENGYRISRKQRNSTDKDKWYDIVKGNLVLSPRIIGKVKMEYFPKPFELDPTETGDVDLDFPDNIFYQICTLKLAEYYKIKQGGDISGIELLLEEAWNTYRNILNRDLDQPNVITDVYHGNNTWNWME